MFVSFIPLCVPWCAKCCDSVGIHLLLLNGRSRFAMVLVFVFLCLLGSCIDTLFCCRVHSRSSSHGSPLDGFGSPSRFFQWSFVQFVSPTGRFLVRRYPFLFVHLLAMVLPKLACDSCEYDWFSVSHGWCFGCGFPYYGCPPPLSFPHVVCALLPWES